MKTMTFGLRRLGSLVSFFAASAAALAQPTILTEPQGEIQLVGGSATFSVSAVTPAPTPELPAVTSGTLRLWLKADAGVVANASGGVSVWRDQSGNTNDASQSNAALQPSFAHPASMGGKAALAFNGIQDGVRGSLLQGAGDVGTPGALTAFTVYSAETVSNDADILWLMGDAGNFGACRGRSFLYEDLNFTTWGYDYQTPYAGPLNTCRITTDEVNTNLSSLRIYDLSTNSSTNFTLPMANASAPAPGYSVGGINFVNPDNFHGDIAEIIIYRGTLSHADREAVVAYLEEKYLQAGSTAGLAYQWEQNGTNIAEATNSTLTITNLQLTDSGVYRVIVSDNESSIASSNALLSVGIAPTFSSQPQGQEVVQGTNVSFSVMAEGTGPLAYQWRFNGAVIDQATNSSLVLSNVGAAAGGLYSVGVTSLFGSVLSSSAVLSVISAPSIGLQPESQSIVTGGSVTFNVGDNLPPVGSGTLRLWLKADAGVVTNSSGQVSVWQDQSGNANNASQVHSNQQPLLATSIPGLSGRPAIRFNGVQDNVNGDMLRGTGDVAIPDAMTSFVVYNAFSTRNYENILWLAGVPGGDYGAVRTDYISTGDMAFSTWAYVDILPFIAPTNTYRIWNDRVNTNLSSLEIFDASKTSATNFSETMLPTLSPQPGYYVGGLDPSLGYVARDRTLNGDIAELIIYRGYLTDSDRLAVFNYLQEKYFIGSQDMVSYQWQFDGTNIEGATNSSLTLTNVQSVNAGVYTVILSNSIGSVTSSNAVLTVDLAPAITLNPVSQAIVAGGSASFSGSASGTGPLSYQWEFDGSAVAGATNATLTLSNVPTSAGGSYQLIASSPYGSAASTSAVLTVMISTIQAGNVSASGGSTVTLPVQLIAVGTEAGLGFSLDFDTTILTYVGAVVGNDAQGSLFLVNTNQAASGHLGVVVDLTGGAFPAGTNEVAEVTFLAGVLTNATTTPITFGSEPTAEGVSDASANPLLATYVDGVVSIGQTILEGDVWPQPGGDGAVTISDWVQEGRFVAGLDTITNAAEMQRADCAPRGTSGDGQITVADWVQVGRYAAGLDPLTAVGEAPSPTAVRKEPSKNDAPRAIRIVPLTQGGITSAVAVELAAQGGESSVGFSVAFDPATLRFVSAAVGSGASSAVLYQNVVQAASGHVGFLVGFNLQGSPKSFAPGLQQVVRLNFASVSYSNSVALNFSDAPVGCGLADINAIPLPASFQNAALAIGGSAWPVLNIEHANGGIYLSWPAAATGFSLETASSLGKAWSPVTAMPATNGANIILTAPNSAGSSFFRLRHN